MKNSNNNDSGPRGSSVDHEQSTPNANCSPSALNGDVDPTTRSGPSGRSMTIPEFCANQAIGKSTYYELQRRGLGPKVMHLLGAVRISSASEAEWMKRMESGTPAYVPVFAPKLPKRNEDDPSNDTKTRSRRTKRRSKERASAFGSKSTNPGEKRRSGGKTRLRAKRQRLEEDVFNSSDLEDENLDEDRTRERKKRRSKQRRLTRSKRRDRNA
jgi:hypothetical protein